MKSIIFTAALFLVSALHAQGALRFEATPTSKVKIDGTSTVHDWTVESQIIGGFMEVDPSFPLDASATSTPTLKMVPKVEVNIPVRSLKSGKKPMDSIMHTAMKQTEHPKIEYRLLEMKPSESAHVAGTPFKYETKGELTVSGVKKTISMPVLIEPLDKTRVKISGTTAVKMTDFGIAPPAPKIALGFIKTGDDVKIAFEWLTTQKAAEAKTGS